VKQEDRTQERGNYAVRVNKRTGHKNEVTMQYSETREQDTRTMQTVASKIKVSRETRWNDTKIRCHLTDNFVLNTGANHLISDNYRAFM
jgi:hypothetical protein